MASAKTTQSFFSTSEGILFKSQLQQMVDSLSYNTVSSYSADTSLYPDNLIPFVNKHMNYLIKHPMLDANKYLANLKLMTRVV